MVCVFLNASGETQSPHNGKRRRFTGASGSGLVLGLPFQYALDSLAVAIQNESGNITVLSRGGLLRDGMEKRLAYQHERVDTCSAPKHLYLVDRWSVRGLPDNARSQAREAVICLGFPRELASELSRDFGISPGSDVMLLVITTNWTARLLREWHQVREEIARACLRPVSTIKAIMRAKYEIKCIRGFPGAAGIAWGTMATALAGLGRIDLADRAHLVMRRNYVDIGKAVGLSPVVLVQARRSPK